MTHNAILASINSLFVCRAKTEPNDSRARIIPHAVPVRRERQDSRGIFVRFSEQKMPIELANTPDPAYVCAMIEQSDNIQNLIDDFAFLDDWEDRYMHVIELGKSLAPLSDAEKNDVTKVKGCVSQVWLVKDVSGMS